MDKLDSTRFTRKDVQQPMRVGIGAMPTEAGLIVYRRDRSGAFVPMSYAPLSALREDAEQASDQAKPEEAQ